MSYDDDPLDFRDADYDFRRPREVPAKLRIPAIFLIIVGVLNVFGGIYLVIDGVFVMMNPQINIQLPANLGPQPTPQQMATYGMGYLILGILGIIAAAVTIFGGARMVVAKSYGLAVTASVLAAIPGLSCMGCCGIGEGIGIWSLIILVSPDVKAVFS
jgi:hypothetical protein